MQRTDYPQSVATLQGGFEDGRETRVKNLDIVSSETAEPASLQVLLKEMHSEFCAHSWKKLPVDITPRDLLDWENDKRPTVIHYYYDRSSKNIAPVLVAAASVADAISHDSRINGFPVLARCYIRPSFRGKGLYRKILRHRLSALINRHGAELNAIHMGTADNRVDRTITDRSLPWNGFVRIGWENLSIGSETVRVGGYLLFSPSFAKSLLQASSELNAPNGGLMAYSTFEELLAGRWSGPGDAYSRIVDMLSDDPLAVEKKIVSPVRELTEFCASIPLEYTPLSEEKTHRSVGRISTVPTSTG